MTEHKKHYTIDALIGKAEHYLQDMPSSDDESDSYEEDNSLFTHGQDYR
jgi:hypothetical protein